MTFVVSNVRVEPTKKQICALATKSRQDFDLTCCVTPPRRRLNSGICIRHAALCCDRNRNVVRYVFYLCRHAGVAVAAAAVVVAFSFLCGGNDLSFSKKNHLDSLPNNTSTLSLSTCISLSLSLFPFISF
jgi:hypothetical protein